MKKCCAALLAMLPFAAVAYPVEVEKQLNGAEITVTAYGTDQSMGSVNLSNYGEANAQCTVVFRNGPEPARIRKVSIAAGRASDVSARFNRGIIKLRVAVTCKVA